MMNDKLCLQLRQVATTCCLFSACLATTQRQQQLSYLTQDLLSEQASPVLDALDKACVYDDGGLTESGMEAWINVRTVLQSPRLILSLIQLYRDKSTGRNRQAINASTSKQQARCHALLHN